MFLLFMEKIHGFQESFTSYMNSEYHQCSRQLKLSHGLQIHTELGFLKGKKNLYNYSVVRNVSA